MTDGVQITHLDSGLTILTERMERVETVSFGAYAGVGTRHETAPENGVSHFLEHMAFKGTEKRNAVEIAEAVEDVGGHINAYTSREQTAYYVKMLKDDLPLGIDIIGDILCHSTFDANEFERERGVILQEIGQANDTPDDIVFDHFQQAAYPGQPMGWPTLGTEAIIKSLSPDVLQRYMRAHYTPKNIVVSASGKLDHQQVVDLVSEHFADLPNATQTPPVPGIYGGGEYREIRDLDQAHLVLGFPAVGYSDPDFHAAMLLSTLLGGGMSSRLFQEIREKRGLVYSIYSFALPNNDAGLFGIYAGTGEAEAAELVPVTLGELAKVQESVTDAELRRARAQVKAGLLMSLESTGSRCEQLARQWQVFGRIVPIAETVAKIDGVTEADITRVAARIFRGKPTLAAIGPIGRVPQMPKILERLAA
ncbi:M16 family metallopeptidase [Acidiphilium acidophilum]|uniref:Pitrilysin family protein n=1 Tax=Acidiphilium acidophilum TaxID=76588 RepID=A0AAW9DQU1_ACIAO|nr:pitrilysin family protein [Acidiphilium acidophilum]MDX5931266.1 pitrilysin family protein [Acidiphilium acidophilum]